MTASKVVAPLTSPSLPDEVSTWKPPTEKMLEVEKKKLAAAKIWCRVIAKGSNCEDWWCSQALGGHGRSHDVGSRDYRDLVGASET